MLFSPRDVTVYVPAYNADTTLCSCLDSVFSQSAAPARIMVVDDGSALPVQSNSRVDVLRHDSNMGLASARNTALARCGTALLAGLDSDVVLDQRWLERLLGAMNAGAFAGVGGRMIERFNVALADRWRAVHMAQHWGEAPITHPRFLFGSNTLFVSELLRGVGGYDVRNRTNNEDRIISEALYAKGHELGYVPSATCEHLRRDSCRSVLNGYWQWHHAKGLTGGDYASPEGIIARIARVNFGIFRYRFELDRNEGRTEFLPLDLAIPWVFCSRDLQLFARLRACSCPNLVEKCGEGVSGEARRVLKALLDQPGCKSTCDGWESVYLKEFSRCLAEFKWFDAEAESVAFFNAIE